MPTHSKPSDVIERDRRAVRAAHFEKSVAHAAVARMHEQRDQQLAADAAPAEVLARRRD